MNNILTSIMSMVSVCKQFIMYNISACKSLPVGLGRWYLTAYNICDSLVPLFYYNKILSYKYITYVLVESAAMYLGFVITSPFPYFCNSANRYRAGTPIYRDGQLVLHRFTTNKNPFY